MYTSTNPTLRAVSDCSSLVSLLGSTGWFGLACRCLLCDVLFPVVTDGCCTIAVSSSFIVDACRFTPFGVVSAFSADRCLYDPISVYQSMMIRGITYQSWQWTILH